MRMPWRWTLLLVACLGMGAEDITAQAAPETDAQHVGRRKPRKRRTRRSSRRTPRRRTVPNARETERALHNERLVLLGRMREINEEVKDAELAARLTRIDELERHRHELALQLMDREAGGAR